MITDDASAAFFESLRREKPKRARLAVFTRTARVGTDPASDRLLRMAADAPVPVAVIYGKAWLYQVTEVLGTTAEENLRIIRESIRGACREKILIADKYTAYC